MYFWSLLLHCSKQYTLQLPPIGTPWSSDYWIFLRTLQINSPNEVWTHTCARKVTPVQFFLTPLIRSQPQLSPPSPCTVIITSASSAVCVCKRCTAGRAIETQPPNDRMALSRFAFTLCQHSCNSTFGKSPNESHQPFEPKAVFHSFILG